MNFDLIGLTIKDEDDFNNFVEKLVEVLGGAVIIIILIANKTIGYISPKWEKEKCESMSVVDEYGDI